VRSELLSRIGQIAANDCHAFINGKAVEPASRLVDELSKVCPPRFRHSKARAVYQLRLSSPADTIILTVKQDDRMTDEFWVFWDTYGATRIGTIQSGSFANLLASASTPEIVETPASDK
jgi:hypothetical protein